MEQQRLLFLLFLLFVLVLGPGSGPVQGSVIRRTFWYKRDPRTWAEAQDYCTRVDRASLATLVKDEDLAQVQMRHYKAWFGLRRTDTRWNWVTGSTVVDMSNSSLVSPAPEGSGGSGESDPDTWWDRWWKTHVFHNDELPKTGEDCGKLVYSSFKARADTCGKKLFVFCQDLIWPVYRFIPQTMSWFDGQQYCNKHHYGYMPYLTGASLQDQNFPVWIHSDFRNQGASGPDASSDMCVSVWSQSKSMSVHSCSEAFPSLCSTHNVVLVQEPLTWEQGLETCRNINSTSTHRMLSLEPDELLYAQSLAHNANTSKVWVGLRFLGGSWFWSDGGAVSLSSLPECPDPGLRCGALVLNGTSDLLIEPSDCSLALNVLCYREP